MWLVVIYLGLIMVLLAMMSRLPHSTTIQQRRIEDMLDRGEPGAEEAMREMLEGRGEQVEKP
jgi:hypothetical protein